MTLRQFFRCRLPRESELDEEIQSHLQLAAQDRIQHGEAPEHAAMAARREFGNVTLIKEAAREIRGWAWIHRLWQDVSYGVRNLRRTPGSTATMILTLALGIGASTTIFSILD